MSEATEWKVDRHGWGKGPWDDEPDRIEFRTAKGYPGLIVRSMVGNLCGYVGVPPGHPAHGRTCFELDRVVPTDIEITYAERCKGPVCHVAAEGEPDNVWWVGFHTAYGGSLMPFMGEMVPEGQRRLIDLGFVYPDVPTVKRRVEALAVDLETYAARPVAIPADEEP